MIEYFIMFGSICVAPFDLPTNYKCLNFYEEPMIYYENKEKCVMKAEEFHKNLEIRLYEKNLFIVGIEIFCKPTKKVDIPA